MSRWRCTGFRVAAWLLEPFALLLGFVGLPSSPRVRSQPCDQDGYSEDKQAAWGLFLERVSKGQTLVTGDGTEDGGYRAQADKSKGTTDALNQSWEREPHQLRPLTVSK